VTAVDRSLTTGGRGRGRSASRLAWLLYVLALALVALAAGLWLVVHRPVPGAVGYGYWREGLVTTLAYATVGALITTRRPAHPVGWLFLGAGLVGAAQLATGEFAAAFLAASGPSVAVAVAAWASSLFQLVVVGLLVCLLLLFPTGRPPSRRWWVLVWVVAAGVVLFSVGAGLAPARYQDFPGVENPFGIAGLATVLGWVDGVGGILFVAGLLGALASLVVRFTRARDLERQQLKWFVYAAGLGVAVVVLPIPIPRLPRLDTGSGRPLGRGGRGRAALSAVRHRPDHQPHPGLWPAHRHPWAGVCGRVADIHSGDGGRVGRVGPAELAGRGCDPGGGRGVPAGPPPHPVRGGSPL
jgi:uncharacterized membrane protein YhaH (DUF805 family)